MTTHKLSDGGYWCVFCDKDLPSIGSTCRNIDCHSLGYLHMGICDNQECQDRYHASPYYAFEVNAPFGRIKDFYYRDSFAKPAKNNR